jgi:ABC-type glycerol-3-phosphate transport system permease component
MGYAVRQGLRYAVVVVVLGIVIVPFLWVFLASFRPNSELIQQGIGINLDTLTLDNYRNLQQAAQYFTYLTNSAIVAITSMIVSITLALLAAYSVYRTRYPGRRPLYLALIITYVFPGVVLLIPLYQLMGKVGLINNLLSLVIVNVTFTAPFSVWLMRGFFGAIPAGIEEAAAIDGAGRMRILFPSSFRSPRRASRRRPSSRSCGPGRNTCSPRLSLWTRGRRPCPWVWERLSSSTTSTGASSPPRPWPPPCRSS